MLVPHATSSVLLLMYFFNFENIYFPDAFCIFFANNSEFASSSTNTKKDIEFVSSFIIGNVYCKNWNY